MFASLLLAAVTLGVPDELWADPFGISFELTVLTWETREPDKLGVKTDPPKEARMIAQMTLHVPEPDGAPARASTKAKNTDGIATLGIKVVSMKSDARSVTIKGQAVYSSGRVTANVGLWGVIEDLDQTLPLGTTFVCGGSIREGVAEMMVLKPYRWQKGKPIAEK